MNLREAAKRGKLDVVRAEVETMDSPPLEPLLLAACQDFHTVRKTRHHVELVGWLLEIGAQPNDEMIYQASRGGHHQIVAAIMRGYSPGAHAMAAAGDVIGMQRVLESDTSTGVAVDHEGKPPLHCCSASALGKDHQQTGRDLRQIARLLLAAGASIDLATTCGGLENVTPLVHTCWTGGDEEMLELLIEAGAEPTPMALWAAVGHFQRHGDGHYELAERLLQLGVDVNHHDGRTMLHSFAAHEDSKGVAWLLAHGASVHAVDAEGATPLHSAARRNTGVKVIELLLLASAEADAEDDLGQRPIDLARGHRRQRVIEYLSRS